MLTGVRVTARPVPVAATFLPTASLQPLWPVDSELELQVEPCFSTLLSQRKKKRNFWAQFLLHNMIHSFLLLCCTTKSEKSGLLHPRSSSSSIAAASTFCSPCSELPWTGKFFLPSISSHLRFLPYFPSSPFTPLLFPVLFPFSITPLCSPFVSSLSFIASPLSFYNE